MRSDRLAFDLILNIGLLVIIANLLSKLRLIQNMLVQEARDWRRQMVLSMLFGGIIMLSTYTSIDIGSYNLNTRVIGGMAAGLLGGPLVGMYASLLGAVYVYFFSSPSAFAAASAFSTALFGLLGGGFYPYFQRGKWKYKDLFFLTCFAEVCDMIAILRLASPFDMAFQTVLQVAGPMIILNSCGILLFISSFNNVFIQQDLESSRQLQLSSELSRKCIPLLRKGLKNRDDIEEMADIILKETDWTGIMVLDRTEIIAWKHKGIPLELEDMKNIPLIAREAMDNARLTTVSQVARDNPLYEIVKDYSLIAAPFVIHEQSIGCLVAWTKRQWVMRRSEMVLLQNIATIGSAQIAMAELENQKRMRQKAEFKALQFQVNPHFLFNALNTISCVCRENPDRARELLIILANYFRYNLNNEVYMVPMADELDHVKDYLELEKARFEEKLEVIYKINGKLDTPVPTLILQPIVENAVKHGADGRGYRYVSIRIEDKKDELQVCISDHGKGFPKEVLEKLDQEEQTGRSVGLMNVHKRMKSIYGEDHGLKIVNSDQGSCVELRFDKKVTKEREDEDSDS
ncbi:LytS/YhcK type 5TM receptor domain-containing protein [Clostridium sp. AM58-1XD]|uniref:LytS/YhcK type 5TM receptor domain-containing protein n=1 Tax=Clostridium sp. AM58-1XD TaxID=2292307 RepID=UPI001FA8EF8D|nr:LytS/YhcK type 5TM receptor domain-containing protein [Clostridium sp. AM58-1XD]